MPSLTSCIFEKSNFTGAAECYSVRYGTWAWVTWTFNNRHASLARARPDSEVVIALVPLMDTSANRSLIDGFLPSGVSRTSGIRAGMVPYSAVPYSSNHPGRHPAWRILVDLSFRVEIDLPWYCFAPGNDTRATIHYYIHVFLNASRNLRANVDGWSWSRTESAGFCGGAVADQLNSNVPAGMGPLQSSLNSQLGPFASLRFSEIYFLPGDGRNNGRQDVPDVRNEAALVLIP
jgi:hypothetical protein